MKIKSLITWPHPSGEGVIEDKVYDVQDLSNFPRQVGVMSEDCGGLTWLSEDYYGTQEFEVIEL